MRKSLLGFGGLVLSLGATAASAEIVADFQDDFTYPAPSNGWSYHWNANGAIGNSANYVALVPDAAGRYETVDQTPDAFPDPAPGASLSLTNTTLIPGQGTAQTPNAFERYVIAAYTVSAADIAAAGGGNELWLQEYSFAVSATSVDGITARLYRNDTLLLSQPLTPGITFDHNIPDPNGGPIPLGAFNAGDRLLVAIGANGPFAPVAGGNDTGDALVMDLKIALVPEPATALTSAAGALALIIRRRRPR